MSVAADPARIRGLGRLEATYIWYAWTIALLLAICGAEVPGRWAWFAAHLAVVVPAVLLSRAHLAWRFLAACILTPTAFSTLGVILPDLVPEAVHWGIARLDEQVGGGVVRAAVVGVSPLLVEVSQVAYATFYFLPIVLGVALLLQRRRDAALQVAELAVGGLLLSYLGYLVFPALPPYRFLDYAEPLAGLATFEFLHGLLYDLEALREDCMPSGHTMVTLLVVFSAWRFDKRQLLWLLPLALPLVFATIALRYHWWVDLVAALPFAALALLLFSRRVDDPTPVQA